MNIINHEVKLPTPREDFYNITQQGTGSFM